MQTYFFGVFDGLLLLLPELGGLFPLPDPDGLPVLLGPFGTGVDDFAILIDVFYLPTTFNVIVGLV